MAAEIVETYPEAKIELIEGSGGIFDVHADGKQVWSKAESGRFPENHEVLDNISALK